MSQPPPTSLDDYDAIAAAVMETERGRWFLQEFARRNRAADTAQILDALALLEARMQAPQPLPPAERASGDEPARLSSGVEGDAEVRPTPTLMLAPPAGAGPTAPEIAELAVVPSLDDALAGLDIVDEPTLPSSIARMWGADEPADLRTAASRSDAGPQPGALRPNPPLARPTPLLESLSDAEKALLFA